MPAISNAFQHNIDLVKEYVRSWLNAGRALREIKDKKQYLETHETFEAFCKDFGLSKSRAYQLIEAAVAHDDLASTNGRQALPENERQARALADSAPDAKTRQTVWNGTNQAAPKDSSGRPQISGALVTKVASGIRGTKPHAKKNEKPAQDHDDGPATLPLPIPEREANPNPLAKERLTLADALAELGTVIEEIQALWPLDEMDILPAKLRKLADEIDKKNELKVTA